MNKVLILANNDIGLYRFRKELISELVKKYDVYISLPKGGFVTNLIDMGCKYIETPISRRGTNPIADLKLFIKYLRILRRLRPKVVLTYTIKPNIYGGLACRLLNVQYIANITGLGSAAENGGVLQKLILWLYGISLKRSECVFFQNKENQELFIKKKIVRGKHKLIPGSGVNLSEYRIHEYPSDSTIHFLFVSRVMKEKGVDQYLEAAKYIKSKYPNTIFHILGFCEEEYEKKLNDMHEQGIIVYHGLQKDVQSFYKISHCIVHPSYYPEGMSNVLLESAACGRPLITTKRSGCKEIVDEGVNGFFVNERDTNDLIDKIEKFINLDYEVKKRMGLASRKKVEGSFDRKIIIQNYLAEISNIE